MNKLELYAHTDESGILHIQNRARMLEFAREHPGKNWVVKIERRGSKRSSPQNRFYWGCVVHEVRLGFLDIGYDCSPEEVHHYLKEKFNPITIENKDGVCIEVPGSTTTLTKTQFAEYIEKITRFAAEFLNRTIPEPNQPLEMKFE